MKYSIRILAVLAVLQTLLIAFLLKGGTELESHAQGKALLKFNTTEVDTIILKQQEMNLQLVKRNSQWQLADGFPADQQKVDQLLTKLSSLQYSLPVATSSQALKRFKVAADDYTCYLQLKNGTKSLAELYLGTGAGARQSHVRTAEQQSVYTAAIGSYEIPANLDNWQDKTILQLQSNLITSFGFNGVQIHRDLPEDNKTDKAPWQAEKLPEGTALDQQAADDCAAALALLTIDKVAGKDELPEYGMKEPALTVELSYSGGERKYTFGRMANGDDIIVKVSDRDEFFQLPSFSGKQLLDHFDKEKLFPAATASTESTEGGDGITDQSQEQNSGKN
ncbi:DUF4340 domain-containing protein [Desulforhopalus sp. IMCC35007]|uniref:DUF4340 domain-containing protein n=1 Tax=Desulforhopalus sp. IMCC35007 TaxID=2569543 RepID=UPI0010AE56C8|nr:DUF4340 domain-containing protein [Desulforhopalus sp. IMCC35007]TKB05820.1 DUF4340 domain-containing protein [Desulforhopalus sp. IMCC35007]